MRLSPLALAACATLSRWGRQVPCHDRICAPESAICFTNGVQSASPSGLCSSVDSLNAQPNFGDTSTKRSRVSWVALNAPVSVPTCFTCSGKSFAIWAKNALVVSSAGLGTPMYTSLPWANAALTV